MHSGKSGSNQTFLLISAKHWNWASGIRQCFRFLPALTACIWYPAMSVSDKASGLEKQRPSLLENATWHELFIKAIVGLNMAVCCWCVPLWFQWLNSERTFKGLLKINLPEHKHRLLRCNALWSHSLQPAWAEKLDWNTMNIQDIVLTHKYLHANPHYYLTIQKYNKVWPATPLVLIFSLRSHALCVCLFENLFELVALVLKNICSKVETDWTRINDLS